MSAAKAPQPERFLSTAECAELMGCNTETILRAIRATEGNTLRAVRWGRGYKIPASAFAEWQSRLEAV